MERIVLALFACVAAMFIGGAIVLLADTRLLNHAPCGRAAGER